jgi:hypothetical protein
MAMAALFPCGTANHAVIPEIRAILLPRGGGVEALDGVF